MIDEASDPQIKVGPFRGPSGAGPFKTLAPAYRQLLQSLWYASKVYQDEGDGGARGAQLACKAVVDFLRMRHQSAELGAPLQHMFKAFDDLSRGLNPEIFSRDLTARERSRTTRGWHVRMLASVAMDVLMELGMSKRDAGNLVVRLTQHWPEVKSASQIGKWRDEFIGKSSRSKQFNLLKNHLLKEQDPQTAVRQLLKNPMLPRIQK